MSDAPSKRSTLNRPVFAWSTALILALVGYAALFPESAAQRFSVIQNNIIANAGWFYVLTVALILLYVAFLGLSRFGDIKLGPDHAEPAFNNKSWFAMLFSAGMGIGLMFFGVAEPVMHFMAPPVGEPGTVEAAKEAMKLTFFHWGLHAWAIYAIVALILAFFAYRHGLPLTLRSALYPLIGDKIYGPIGHAVDIFAIIGTVFGVATSLGFGVLQVNSGLQHLFGIPVSENVQVVLIIAITALATLSVVSGLEKGIRRLSELNLLLAVGLMGLILVLGPTVLLLQTFVENTGSYLSEIVSKTFNLYAYDPTDWLGGWTLFYWGWWISWSPFVGMFIARISRGRTIRQFVMGVLFVPAGFTLAWMTVFGNSAIDMILHQGMSQLGEVISQDSALALFVFLEQFPMSALLSAIAMLMVVVFFVTSADSGSMVVDMLASGGNDKTPLWQRIFWASTMGIVAVVLLMAGGLSALQTAAIASALPFSVVLMVAAYGLLEALRVDLHKKNSQQAANLAPRVTRNPVPWQRRLRNTMQFPRRSHVNRFIDEVVYPAMEEMLLELRKQGVEVNLDKDEETHRTRLEVLFGDEMDFEYEVLPRAYMRPSFVMTEEDESDEESKYFRAEVHLREGGQDYDVMGWSREQVLGDMLDQYEKHLHFLHVVRE
ncbi:BCCT family transporter [Ferrimonas balearica]|uniref:BCCT family transporter n=1 Tax=Ferrimonas balearica TaxID=44012 RepID=UPI001F3BB7F1|nr:choline BCCT transporter BetT [Ferrimonas balearica]MBY6019268.1 choline BCCT transporter BetT [Halomonas denitrificans]MBY6095871.1 choline BCCT transporter BetT [Ferrimonas balearica]